MVNRIMLLTKLQIPLNYLIHIVIVEMQLQFLLRLQQTVINNLLRLKAFLQLDTLGQTLRKVFTVFKKLKLRIKLFLSQFKQYKDPKENLYPGIW